MLWRPNTIWISHKEADSHTFATEGGKKKVLGTDGEIVTACLLRDLFGSILYLSLQRKVDMQEVLRYSLTPLLMPYWWKHAKVTKINVAEISNCRPFTNINRCYNNWCNVLHLHNDLPVTFGGVTRCIISRIIDAEGEVVHFVSDKYMTPTIKDRLEHPLAILQDLLKKGQVALRNSKLKESLIMFLLESWMDDDNTQLFRGRTLFANNNDLCNKFYVQNGNVCCVELQDLYCSHEEAEWWYNRSNWELCFHFVLEEKVDEDEVRLKVLLEKHKPKNGDGNICM